MPALGETGGLLVCVRVPVVERYTRGQHYNWASARNDRVGLWRLCVSFPLAAHCSNPPTDEPRDRLRRVLLLIARSNTQKTQTQKYIYLVFLIQKREQMAGDLCAARPLKVHVLLPAAFVSNKRERHLDVTKATWEFLFWFCQVWNNRCSPSESWKCCCCSVQGICLVVLLWKKKTWKYFLPTWKQ